MHTLDHLVVAAATLDEGVRWVEARVGVGLEPGGRHPTFGTHNRLLSLGPDTYLEVIAVDPDATAPARPRWFELDSPGMRRRLETGPALIHWVVRVPTLAGEPHVLHLRRGPSEWSIGVAPDGRMPVGGLAPSRIAWSTPPPSTALPDRGIRLQRLELSAPEPTLVRRAVERVAGAVSVRTGPASLVATLSTPTGTAILRG